jgi:hypothetical protein
MGKGYCDYEKLTKFDMDFSENMWTLVEVIFINTEDFMEYANIQGALVDY